MNTIKKFFLSVVVICSFVIYAIYQQSSDKTVAPALTTQQTSPIINPPRRNPIRDIFGGGEDDGGVRRVTPQTQTPPNNTPVQTTPVPASSLYKNGEYTGTLADAYYGNVQVKAVIQNGKIANVIFLDYPQDRQTSVRINTQAMPLLKDEAIQAQSATVDIISGATQTSGAFQESLASALSKAKI